MSDKYQIGIPPSIDAKMSAWNLPADLWRLMEDRLRNDLASDPLTRLVPCTAPWGERLNLYSFVIRESDTVQHCFMFHFVYGEDERSLDVVECGYSRIESFPDAPRLPSE